MKGPLSAERLFFISALLFAVGYMAYMAVWYIWPLPMLPEEVIATLPPDPAMVPGSVPFILSHIGWFLPIAGVVTLALGFVARK